MANDKPRQQVRYEDTVRAALVEKHGYKNPHQIPRIEKITINMNVVDLGKVDTLVQEGVYANRTDFIGTAWFSFGGLHR